MQPISLRFVTLVTTLFALLAAAPAWAQTTTGALKGEIVNQADEPLEGVALTLTGDNLIGGAQTSATNADGRFRFLGLAPGEYRLDAELEGYKTIIRTNLQVSMGRDINIRLVMEIPEVGETVEVIDRRPVIDTESSAQSITFNTEFLQNLPTGRSFQDVVQFLPGVTGGSNPNINGGTLQSNQYYLDGTNTTDPTTGTFAMNFNYDAIEDLEVITAGYDARYNQGLGGTINIVTKSGGNTFEGDFSGYFQTTGFQAKGGELAPIQNPSEFNRVQAYASLGGPIVKDRFWFFLSYNFTHSTFFASPDASIGRDYGLFPQSPQRTNFHNFLVKLTAQPIARHKLTFTFRADPGSFQNNDQRSFVTNSAEELWRQGGFGVVLEHQATLGGWGVLTTNVNYQLSRIAVQPMIWKECADRTNFGYCNDPDLQVSQVRGLQNGLYYGSSGAYDYNSRHRVAGTMNLRASVDRVLGSHTIDTGFGVEPIWSRRQFGYVNNEIIYAEPQDLNGNGTTLDPAEVNDFDSYENQLRFLIARDWNINQSGLIGRIYLQDKWIPTRGLTFNLGGSLSLAQLNNNAGDAVISTRAFTWGPSVSWDPFRDGKTNLSVSFAQIVDPGILSLSGFVNNQTFNSERFSWDAAQKRWSDTSGQAQTPANDIQHSDLVPARSNEIFVRAQREIARDMSAEVSFLYRNFTNSWEDDEVNFIWNEDGTNVVGFRNGQDGTIQRLRTPEQARRQYYAFTLLVRKQLSDNLELFGSYTFSRLRSNTAGRSVNDRLGISQDFDNPTQRWVEDGIAAADIPHVFRLLVTYNNPNVWKIAENFSMGYSFGATFELASGNPLNRLGWNDYYEAYSNYLLRRGTQERLPATSNLDLRAALAFSIAGTELDVIVQCFNLLNSVSTLNASQAAVGPDGEPVELSGNRGPAYALPTAFQRGRRFELGLRFHF